MAEDLRMKEQEQEEHRSSCLVVERTRPHSSSNSSRRHKEGYGEILRGGILGLMVRRPGTSSTSSTSSTSRRCLTLLPVAPTRRRMKESARRMSHLSIRLSMKCKSVSARKVDWKNEAGRRRRRYKGGRCPRSNSSNSSTSSTSSRGL